MKPNTFTRLYVHCIFTPKGRSPLLSTPLREKVHKYIYGIIKEKRCFPVAINGTEDHIHILIGYPPDIAISDLIRDIKRSSSFFINGLSETFLKFRWQEGFGAFTVGYRELDYVYKYIVNQEDHHSKKSFRDEFTTILNDQKIKYDQKYLFEFYD